MKSSDRKSSLTGPSMAAHMMCLHGEIQPPRASERRSAAISHDYLPRFILTLKIKRILVPKDSTSMTTMSTQPWITHSWHRSSSPHALAGCSPHQPVIWCHVCLCLLLALLTKTIRGSCLQQLAIMRTIRMEVSLWIQRLGSYRSSITIHRSPPATSIPEIPHVQLITQRKRNCNPHRRLLRNFPKVSLSFYSQDIEWLNSQSLTHQDKEKKIHK